MENPANTIIEVAMSHSVPRCLHVVAEMGIADVLDDSPRTAADLAARTSTNANALGRALRLLSAYGIFEPGQDDGGHAGFAHTAASRLLRSDHPQSVRSFVRMIGNEINWKSFELLRHSIRTGQPAAEQVTPGGNWAYYSQHPEDSRIFDEAMMGKAYGQIAGIVEGYDFSAFETIADIGGGRGHLLQAVLAANPNATGVLFDQPHVVADIASVNLTAQGGDFFKDVLPVCDAYLLMQVIHDWNDAESIDILKAIRRSSPAHAKLLLVEGILLDDSNPHWIKMLDITMLTLLGGRERTRLEFESLLSHAGFRLDKVIDVGLGTFIMEASTI